MNNCTHSSDLRDADPLSSVLIAAADARVKQANAIGQPCYLVLSVKDLRRMLKAAEVRAAIAYPVGTGNPFDGDKRANSCFSFESTVKPDSKGVLQVGSFDIAKGPR